MAAIRANGRVLVLGQRTRLKSSVSSKRNTGRRTGSHDPARDSVSSIPPWQRSSSVPFLFTAGRLATSRCGGTWQRGARGQGPRVSTAGNNRNRRIIPSLTRREILHKPEARGGGSGSSRRQDRSGTAESLCQGCRNSCAEFPTKRASRTQLPLTEAPAAGAPGTPGVCAKANAG